MCEYLYMFRILTLLGKNKPVIVFLFYQTPT